MQLHFRSAAHDGSGDGSRSARWGLQLERSAPVLLARPAPRQSPDPLPRDGFADIEAGQRAPDSRARSEVCRRDTYVEHELTRGTVSCRRVPRVPARAAPRHWEWRLAARSSVAPEGFFICDKGYHHI